MKKDLKYYMDLPYTIIVKKDETGEYVASYAELPFCDGVGKTPAAAIKELEIHKRLKIQAQLEDGISIPEPKKQTRTQGIKSLKPSKTTAKVATR